MTVKHVPVLIVGAGAAGLATSALLTKHGVRSLLVEKRSETFIYPKARNLSFRSLEILRGLGLADEIHAIAHGVSDMLTRPTLNSADERRAFDVNAIFAPFKDLSPEPGGQYCPQSAFEPILLAHIRRDGGEVRYNTGLDSFEQDEGGITAVIRDRESGETEAVRAEYLVAADGVHSPIRDAVGVTTAGYGALPIYVVFIYFRAPWRKFVPRLEGGDGIQVSNPDVEGIFLSVRDDFGMFITTYFPGRGESADQFTAQRCRELLTKAVGEPIDVEVIDVAPWQPYERVADQFRCGRAFLVGDAAHTMPPFKAGGANTAIQSAHNLAWKLAAVLKGTAGSDLLDTYHAERHPVGRFNARQSLTGPSLAFLKLDDNRPTLPAQEEAPMFALLIGYQYRSAAVVSDEPGPTDPGAVSLVQELRGQSGTRVPHAWVVDDGRRVSTLDLLGPGFTLFTGDDDAAWSEAAAEASKTIGVPITVRRIGTALDVDGAWAAVTGLAPDAALLVRPDDFVGWRADSCAQEADLDRVVSQILGRAP
ncbi:FAD-dependent monooxygenase [Mycobacterium paraense]|uniref:FAD-dependent monooxygenase n=1 Tax=Mycobacterium paraense TaxID=767916 RepID=UPI000A1687B2|nr:FAD-dependent monooxygenase [Mycobacterium paraense]MCV7443385.1 FAD-dependent monooxygenase [Mycobacterium paraense]ORW40155.1 FAD-binding protein [Mycobacterium paraense]